MHRESQRRPLPVVAQHRPVGLFDLVIGQVPSPLLGDGVGMDLSRLHCQAMGRVVDRLALQCEAASRNRPCSGSKPASAHSGSACSIAHWRKGPTISGVPSELHRGRISATRSRGMATTFRDRSPPLVEQLDPAGLGREHADLVVQLVAQGRDQLLGVAALAAQGLVADFQHDHAAALCAALDWPPAITLASAPSTSILMTSIRSSFCSATTSSSVRTAPARRSRPARPHWRSGRAYCGRNGRPGRAAAWPCRRWRPAPPGPP